MKGLRALLSDFFTLKLGRRRPRVIPPPPSVMGTPATSALTSAAQTFTVGMPTGVQTGEAVVAFIAADGITASTTPGAGSTAGWVIERITRDTVQTLLVAYHLNPPTSGLALVIDVGSGNSEQFSAVAFRVAGHAGAPAIRFAGTSTGAFTVDPPSGPSPRLNSPDPLLVFAAMAANANNVPVSGPAGYTWVASGQAGATSVNSTGIGQDSCSVAYKQVTAVEDDPGVFTFTAGAVRASLSATVVFNAVDMAAEGRVTTAGTWVRHDYVSAEGRARTYHVREPTTGAPPWPVMVAFHGGGNNNAVPSLESVNLDDLCESNQWMLVALQAYNGRWNHGGDMTDASSADPSDDVTYVDDVMTQIAADYSIHATRRWLVGVSAGGAMAYRVACERPAAYPALAVVSSCKQDPQAAHLGTDVLDIHGDADQNIPIDGGVGTDTGNGIVWRDPHLGPAEFAAAGNPSCTFTTVAGGTHDWYAAPLYDTNGAIAAFLALH